MQVTRRRMTGALAALPLLPMLGGCGARSGGGLTIWAMGNEAANLPVLLQSLRLPGGHAAGDGAAAAVDRGA